MQVFQKIGFFYTFSVENTGFSREGILGDLFGGGLRAFYEQFGDINVVGMSLRSSRFLATS